MLFKERVCEQIMRSLPEWFGIEVAIVQYVKDIERLPTFIAVKDSRSIGFLTIKKHNRFAAEIYFIKFGKIYHVY